MIPFERDSGAPRDPRRSRAEGWDSTRLRRGGVDPALFDAMPRPTAPAKSRASSWAGWLIAPLCLASIAAGLLLITRGPDHLFGTAFGIVLALGLMWILACSLFPARADRKCPRCGAAALTRLDPRSAQGVRCRSCSWRDPLRSSFLLAEDDGADLEEIALRERRKRRRS